MTANTTIVLQIIATVVQVLNAVNVVGLPPKWQAAFTGLLTVAQAVQGVIAHYFTPTGVPITTGATITTKEAGSVAASTK